MILGKRQLIMVFICQKSDRNMPLEISKAFEIAPGEIYEDSAYHPCLCVGVEGNEIWGISLIDGSYPRTEELGLSGVRKLTVEEAWSWKLHGPDDEVVPPKNRWWRNR
jgi:hypothetical protein